LNKIEASRWLGKVQAICWALFLVCLPITSFPFFPSGIGGDTLIRPLSIYPLMVLLLIATLPRLFKSPLPKTFLPLFAFVVVALISSVFSLAQGSLPSLEGVSVASRLGRNLITLGIGCAYYITVALIPRSRQDLDASLRWLYLGFSLALAWGSLQAVYVIHFSQSYFNLLSQVQEFISTRKLFTTRVSGATFEPKWFAEQICLLLLPWLLGSVFQGRTVFKWRYRWITVELFLLAWAVAIVLFTFSRTGVAILLLITFMSFLLFPPKKMVARLVPQKLSFLRNKYALAGIATLAIGVLVVVAGANNRYFSRFWTYFTDESVGANRSYLEYIAFDQRFVYWQTAYRIYEAYPALGVGLGNYAFYFDRMLPERDYSRQPEIIRQLTPTEDRARLATPKNLYARILAETGLLGVITFTAFLVAVLGCALFLWFSPGPQDKFWGGAGLLAFIVFLLVVFSFDSFAVPNMWVVFGLITAAAHIPAASPAEQKVAEIQGG